MRITDPVLVPDVSMWCDHINPQQFEDGGCQSVIVGLYFDVINGMRVLKPVCRAQCEAVAKTSMVLQAYYWDDITLNPLEQSAWLADTIQSEGLPIRYVWADDEQWWSDWNKWLLARQGKITWDKVPRATPAAISQHMQLFVTDFRAHYFPATGVYTNNGFVASWAPGMNAWLPQFPAWVPQYGREPAAVTQMSWAQLRAGWLPNYNLILAAGQLPGMVMGHQFTGDLIELPGAYDPYGRELVLDVSVFSQAFIDGLRGGPAPAPAPIPTPVPVPVPEPAYSDYVVMPARINVRMGASASSGWVRYALQGEILHMTGLAKDGYMQMTDTNWVYAQYIKQVMA